MHETKERKEIVKKKYLEVKQQERVGIVRWGKLKVQRRDGVDDAEGDYKATQV